MNKMKLICTIFFIFFAFAVQAKPSTVEPFFLETTLKKKKVSDVVKEISSKLEAKDQKIMRVLNFADVVRGQGVKNFSDYSIVLSCHSDEMQALVAKEPALVNLLPCSIIVYDAGKGNVNVAIPSASAFAKAAGISPESKKLVEAEYARLQKNLNLKLKAGPKVSLGEVYKEMDAGEGDLKEFNTILVSSLQGENLNVVFSQNYGDNMAAHFSCSASLGSQILKKMPQFGVFAPCRVGVFKKNDKIYVGMIQIREVIKSNQARIGKDAMKAALDLDTSVKKALKAATEE